ncbi:MAG: hypothetical protein SXU28_02020 [Pseudomonadota bacterium]|nr:hypothetical protein [Pseudomonadota bacterium]
MKTIITVIAGTALAMSAATAANSGNSTQSGTWKLKTCASNGWTCSNYGTYSSYQSCNAARKSFKQNNPSRHAYCFKV